MTSMRVAVGDPSPPRSLVIVTCCPTSLNGAAIVFVIGAATCARIASCIGAGSGGSSSRSAGSAHKA